MNDQPKNDRPESDRPESDRPQRILGLTGGIGSGKSAVAAAFRLLGVPVVDVDAIAHELSAPGGAAIAPIRAAFGDDMITSAGALDRARMRTRVFQDPMAKARLEAILHPMIAAGSQRRCLAALESGADYVVLEVPLLIESGHHRQRAARMLVVDCPEDVQIQRVIERSGLSREDVQRIMAAQASRAQRLAAADDVIENTGSLADIATRVAALHADYLCRLRENNSLSDG